MINQKLEAVVNAAVKWCEQHDITFDWVCDESDLQGIMLFKKDVKSLSNLFETITPLLEENDVHFQLQKVRGGNIIVFSLKAISESTMSKILAEMGVKAEKMTLDEKLTIAIGSPVQIEQSDKQSDQPIDFVASACKILGEEEEKKEPAKEPICKACGDTGKSSGGGICKACQRRKWNKPVKESYSTKIGKTLGVETTRTPDKFGSKLNAAISVVQEQLNGLATKTGKQPQELFKMFANALRTLGTQMCVGPLQQRLKAQGIKASAARDGLSIILSINNAATGQPPPVARIGYETLENPGDFEKQLKNVLDFSLGEAPGSFDLKQQQIRDQEAAIKDIAKVVAPPNEDESQVQQMMGNGQAPQSTQPAQATPQAQPTQQAQAQPVPAQPAAGQQAAARAAGPKPAGRPGM